MTAVLLRPILITLTISHLFGRFRKKNILHNKLFYKYNNEILYFQQYIPTSSINPTNPYLSHPYLAQAQRPPAPGAHPTPPRLPLQICKYRGLPSFKSKYSP